MPLALMLAVKHASQCDAGMFRGGGCAGCHAADDLQGDSGHAAQEGLQPPGRAGALQPSGAVCRALAGPRLGAAEQLQRAHAAVQAPARGMTEPY